MFQQVIDYVDVEVVLPPPVKKQIWNGTEFVPITLYKSKGWPGIDQVEWLVNVAGSRGSYSKGTYWDFSEPGNFTVMDEKLYIWYQMKWGNK